MRCRRRRRRDRRRRRSPCRDRRGFVEAGKCLSEGSLVELCVAEVNQQFDPLRIVGLEQGDCSGQEVRRCREVAAAKGTAPRATEPLRGPRADRPAFGIDRPADPQLRRESQVLAKKVGAEGTPVDVEKVSDVTNQPNAFAAGIGPTRRIVLFDTLLDGRFSDDSVEVVVAHEFGHIARKHIAKGLGWSVLLAFPIAFLIAEATRRRGGLGDPAVLPYGALVLVVINLALMPFANEISRRYESEADWVALKATNDPAAAESLFEGFAKEGLSQPDPPGWWHIAQLPCR